ncbi:MAG: hypothetical protein J6J52_05415 [Oscillospiraceae bacterium]|nr:hypothetical protein [Oscillospiraceae bacterium]
MKIKEFFKKLVVNMRKDFGMRIISLLIALGAWFIISVSAYPTTTVTYRNIAVEVDLEGSVAERNRLSVIDMSEQTVKATIKGQRASIGGLSSSDFIAKPEITEVNDSGEYELKLNIECKDKNADFEYTVVPDKIKVSFDKIISKSFDLTADIPNIVAADGYLKGNAEVTTPSITITGPEERVNYITKCKIQNLSEMQLTESQEISEGNNLVLYHNNTVISSEGLSLSKNSFAINVPVTMRKTLPLVVSFINVPENISLEDIEYTQSVEEIEVAAPPDKIENLGELYLCTIDLRKVTPGYTVTVPLEFTEESEMENLSQVSEVTLEFPLENLTTRMITVSRNDIVIINKPADYDIIPATTGWDITFVGEAEVLEKLTVDDIVVQLDLSSVSSSITSNVYIRAPIKVYVPGDDVVWATGSQVVAFQAKEK